MKEWKQMIIDKIKYRIMIKSKKKKPSQPKKVIFLIWGFCNLDDA